MGKAVLQALVYADLFDYPLTLDEIQRYLVGLPASRDEIQRTLAADPLIARHTESANGYVTLQGRSGTIALRRAREQAAAVIWPRALHYGHWLSRLPYVRMVAITGALAIDNVDETADIDYFIVAEPGRLWSARAQVISVVRSVMPFGDVICPNYFLSTDALVLDDRSLFTAHEVTQMVPVAGLDVYERFRMLNDWTAAFLPNAGGTPRSVSVSRPHSRVRAAIERLGATRPGDWFEQWEMRRKVRKLGAAGTGEPEAVFSRDVCKGHFGGHGRRSLARFAQQLRGLGLE